jgi:hypothetical protein
MKKITFLIIIFLSLSATLYAQNKIDITLKNGSEKESQTRDQLQRLLKTYDLSKWLFTNKILIDEQAIPHSHPILTLHTRHLKDDDLLLSTFVHEQIHWLLDQNDKETSAAIKDLRALFPKVPVDFPDGAQDEESTYLHLLVNYLEYRADIELLGELKARQVIDFWSTDHYRWIYKTVLERPKDISNIILKYKLMPDSHSQAINK